MHHDGALLEDCIAGGRPQSSAVCNDVDLKKSQEAFEGAMLPSKGEKGDVWIANKVLDAGTFACVT